jgi:hypothetical protein
MGNPMFSNKNGIALPDNKEMKLRWSHHLKHFYCQSEVPNLTYVSYMDTDTSLDICIHILTLK